MSEKPKQNTFRFPLMPKLLSFKLVGRQLHCSMGTSGVISTVWFCSYGLLLQRDFEARIQGISRAAQRRCLETIKKKKKEKNPTELWIQLNLLQHRLQAGTHFPVGSMGFLHSLCKHSKSINFTIILLKKAP